VTPLEVRPDQLTGIYVPTLVPLDRSQRVDVRSFCRHIKYLLAGGVHGLWVNGTSGEFHALSDEELTQVVGTAVKCCGGHVPVIAHVGDTATRLVIEKARRAIAAEAALVSVIPPYYLEYSEAELKRHFQLVSEAINAPVFLYQHPATGQRPLSIEALLGLVRERSIIGIKESSTDLEYYRRLIQAARRAGLVLRCFHGAGGLAQISLSLGGDGLISVISNIIPHVCVRLRDQIQAGRWDEATETQDRIDALYEAFSRSLAGRPNWAPVVAACKWVLCELGILSTATVFDPLEPLSKKEVDSLRRHALPLVHELCGELLTKAGHDAKLPELSPRLVSERSTEAV
jgi:4-hydroxy-tetrahydrodipicolinate synthase